MDSWDLKSYLWPCWCPRTVLLPGSYWYWDVCADYVAKVTFSHELLPKTMFDSVFLLQLGSEVFSISHVATGDHQNHAHWNPRSMLFGLPPHWPWYSWTCSSLDTTPGDLALPSHGKVCPHTQGRNGPTTHHRHGKALPYGMDLQELNLSLTLGARSKWFRQLSSPTTQTLIWGLGLAYPNIYPLMTCWRE